MSGSSYLFPISTDGMQRNAVSRLSSDIVRLICKHLCSVADIVAFARSCKFAYRAIALLFTVTKTGDDQWDGLCVSLVGHVTPIKLQRIIGGSFYHLIGNEMIPVDDLYVYHINRLQKTLMVPYTAPTNVPGCYRRVDTDDKFVHGVRIRAVLQLQQPEDAMHIMRELRRILALSNECFFHCKKRRRLTE